MALTIVKKQAGKATVTTKKSDGTETMAQETVGEEKALVGPTCNVGFDASMTHNLGDYESIRLGVSIHIPCMHGEIDEVFDFAKNWVGQRMDELQKELQEELQKG